MKNKIKKWLGIAEIEEILTREGENKEGNLHLGSEIDGKVEQKDFDKLSADFKELKEKLVKPKSFWDSMSYYVVFGNDTEKEKTVSLEEKFELLEEYLGVEFRKESTKGYKKIIKKKVK